MKTLFLSIVLSITQIIVGQSAIPNYLLLQNKNNSLKLITNRFKANKTQSINENDYGTLQEKNYFNNKENQEIKNKYKHPNPDYTTYFFFPTGYNLPKHSVFYQNHMIGINSIHYAISDYFTIGGGIELISSIIISTFSEQTTLVGYIKPRFSFKLNKQLHIGTGVTLISTNRTFEYNNKKSHFIPLINAVITYGNKDKNISIGGLFGNLPDYDHTYSIVGSGMLRVSNRVILLSENYLTIYQPEENYDIDKAKKNSENLLSFIEGLRIVGKKFGFDLGVILNNEFETIKIRYPFIGFSYRFK